MAAPLRARLAGGRLPARWHQGLAAIVGGGMAGTEVESARLWKVGQLLVQQLLKVLSVSCAYV